MVPDGSTMRERRVVILLHVGPGMDHSHFKVDAFDSLRDDAQIVYLDHRGQGRSDRGNADDWNLDRWADDVVELCDVLGISKPVVVGTSFGGFVAQRYLARYPRHAGGAVLAGTCPRLNLEVVGNAFARLGGDQAGATARRFLSGDTSAAEDFDALCLPLYDTLPIDGEVLARIEMNPDVLAHFLHEWNTMDLRDGLDEVACPVAVVAAGRDPIAPPEAVAELVEALPTSLTDYRFEPDAGHFEVCGQPTANAARAVIAQAAS